MTRASSYAVLLLLASSGECNPFAPTPNLEFVSASVSPTAVPGGGQFIATALVTHNHCNNPRISGWYTGTQVEQSGDAFQSSFTAVLRDTTHKFFSDTLVYFIADCGYLVRQDSVGIHIVPVP